jgi:hypothetical protein
MFVAFRSSRRSFCTRGTCRRVLCGVCAGLLVQMNGPRAGAEPVGEVAPRRTENNDSLRSDADRSKARTLGYAGVEAYAAGDYEQAALALEESLRLFPVPSLGLWSARALVKLGKLIEAEARYRAVAALSADVGDPSVQNAGKADAARERVALSMRIPSLSVRLTGASPAEVSLTIDGLSLSSDQIHLPQSLNPGRHTVVGVRRAERSEVTLELAEQQHRVVSLRFADEFALPKAPPSEPTPLGPAALTAASPPALSPAVDSANGSLQTWGYVVGAAGVVLGGAAVAHYVWNQGRFDSWQTEHRALRAERVSGDYTRRQQLNNQLQSSIDGAEPVGVALALSAGACLASGLTLLMLHARGTSVSASALGPSSAQLDLRGQW